MTKPPTSSDVPLPAVEREMTRLLTRFLDGLDDDAGIDLELAFIDLGGHSLLAMRVVFGLEEAFETEASMASLMEAESVRSFCIDYAAAVAPAP